MKKSISRIIGLIMLIIAIVFIMFALNHPEKSFPWNNTITWLLYGVYFFVIVVLLIAPKMKKWEIPVYWKVAENEKSEFGGNMLMKKFLSLFLCLTCVLTLVACGKKVAPITLPQTDEITSIDITLVRMLSSAYQQEFTFVAFESLINSTPRTRATFSRRCSTPLKSLSPSRMSSFFISRTFIKYCYLSYYYVILPSSFSLYFFLQGILTIPFDFIFLFITKKVNYLFLNS